MIHPELRYISSAGLEPPALPADVRDCAVHFHTVIGPQGSEESEAFAFTVVTPAYLGRTLGHSWGRGYLIVEEFDWHVVVRAVAQLLAQCARSTWHETAAELGRELRREGEGDVDESEGSSD